MTKPYAVQFMNSNTWSMWTEWFDTYTAAWVAFHVARTQDNPARCAMRFLP